MKLEVAEGAVGRLRGLLGRKGFRGLLLLTKCNDVHTFGMREAIDVAFVTGEGRIAASYRGVPPRCRIRSAEAVATLERFASSEPWFDRGDSIAGLDVDARREGMRRAPADRSRPGSRGRALSLNWERRSCR